MRGRHDDAGHVELNAKILRHTPRGCADAIHFVALERLDVLAELLNAVA